MRILLVGNYVPDGSMSMGRFADMLRDGLLRAGEQVDVLIPTPTLGRLWPRGGIAKLLGYLDKFVLFPFSLMARRKHYDVVHICDHSNSMYVRFLRKQAHLVTCHDLLAVRSGLGLVPENPTRLSGRWLQAWILRGLKKTRFIVTVSEKTRTDLMALTNHTDDTTRCIYLTLNYGFYPMPKDEAMELIKPLLPERDDRPFLVHVGGNQWYKNRLGVLRIFERILAETKTYRLLMAGKPLPAALRAFIAEHGMEDSVVELKGTSNAQIGALYSLAEALIFPSLAEGFGWPLLEAQACGCPVFCSNRAPMTETGASSVGYFDPLDAAGAAKVITAGLAEREAMSAEGLRNVQRFTEEKMISAYLDVYAGLVAGR